MQIQIPSPISGGILLSYKCTTSCKHCMYACSRKWKGDWIKKDDLERILDQLAGKIEPCAWGIGINYGLHFTGGEPFMNFRLLLKAVKIASELGIPSLFVETNCFWCRNDEFTERRLRELKDSGLDGILISVNPFIAENVPFERTERCIRLSRKIFGANVIIYQEIFYHLFKKMGLKDTLSFEKAIPALRYAELLPMGRVPYKLGHLFRKYAANAFFGQSCRNELIRSWHIHIDNYCNFIPGYCGGITLGDARDLESLKLDLEERPILKALLTDLKQLFELGKKFGYVERDYISKCHLCVDVRRHLAMNADFDELQPLEFYSHLDD
ncbi:MAG: radical SAM protein [Archaeoglobus sp.]|nr:radical SAM protein [Archaeoglobus sp.]